MSGSSVNIISSPVNNQLRNLYFNSKCDLKNLFKNKQFIRTPGKPNIVFTNQNYTTNSSDMETQNQIAENKCQNHSNNNQRQFNISATVTSIVDSWEADLAKQVKRRPSGQFESCKYYSI